MQYESAHFPLKPSFKLKFDGTQFEVSATYAGNGSGKSVANVKKTAGQETLKNANPVTSFEGETMSVSITFTESE